MTENGDVVLYSEDIRWDINVNTIENGGEKVIELSWGWTAGMSDEQIAGLADDCPSGHASVLVNYDQALDLISELAATLSQFPHPGRKDE